NSVSNAAGFHVAQQLGLEGPNLFIGAGPRVWPQLQRLAALDLANGVVSQALLLVVEDLGDFRVQTALLQGNTPDQPAADFAELAEGLAPRRRVHYKVSALSAATPSSPTRPWGGSPKPAATTRRTVDRQGAFHPAAGQVV